MKVVINTCYGGFGISMEAVREMADLWHKGAKDFLATGETYPYIEKLDRDDPILIEVVERLGEKANGACAKLEIVNITFNYDIIDHDGKEKVEVSGYCDY